MPKLSSPSWCKCQFKVGATHRPFTNHRKAVILDNCVALVQLWWTASALCTCWSSLALVGGHKIPASDTSGSLDPIFPLHGSWKTKNWIQNKHWLHTSTRTSLVKLARLQGQVLHFNGLHSFCGIMGLELVTLYASDRSIFERDCQWRFLLGRKAANCVCKLHGLAFSPAMEGSAARYLWAASVFSDLCCGFCHMFSYYIITRAVELEIRN